MQELMVRFVRETLGLENEACMELVPFAGRGSDRAYYRALWNHGKSAILVHYQTSRIENTYYVDIAKYLHSQGIPVPELLGHDSAACLALMEDLGDLDLWALRNEPWGARKPLYEKTLKAAHALHSLPEEHFPSDQVRLAEPFGPTLYQWERGYFRENFVEGLCGLKLDAGLSLRLETELSGLAERLSSARRSLVHRDLQSQNVMVYQDHIYLIDFQGMRFGTRFYDLGSILCDPYVSFAAHERAELLAFYYGLSEQATSWNDFQNAFWEASAQRLMQALGAYGFLGIKRGLTSYLHHVSPGTRNLRLAAENALSLPALLEVCVQCEASGIPDSRFQISDQR
jgi:N-acetylmuramate 1-kinase